jgi:excisionase family DNA binding protein
MTTKEAATALGLKPVTIRAAIANGSLKATKRGRDWHITPAAVEAYRADSLGKPGRPKKP